jgi:AcrR family transcriptional regulator
MVPKSRPAKERIAQIHAAALELFARKGYHATSMDDIVGKTGLSKGTLYWYFDSKQELFLSLFTQVMKQLVDTWREDIDAGGGSARERLRASLEFFRSYAGRITPLFGILIEAWSMSRQDEVLVEALRDGLYPARSMIMELIDAGVESGEFQVGDPESMAFVLLSLVSGLIIRMGSGYWDLGWDVVLGSVSELLTHGLGVQRSSSDV